MNAAFEENLLDLEVASEHVRSDFADSLVRVETSIDEKYVIFLLNEEIYAVSAAFVTEVIVPLPLTPLPKTPKWFLGIANLRGKIISVIDLLEFWNREKQTSSPNRKLIVLNSKTGDSQIAFAVDKLCEVIDLTDSNLLSGDENSTDFCSRIRYKSNIANLLDAEKLFLSLKF